VAQCLADHLRLRTTQESQRGKSVSQVVKAHLTKTRSPYYPGKVVGDSARVKRLAIQMAEYKAIERYRLSIYLVL